MSFTKLSRDIQTACSRAAMITIMYVMVITTTRIYVYKYV